MRLVAGTELLVHATSIARGQSLGEPLVAGLLTFLLGILIVVGLWTPIAASAEAVIALAYLVLHRGDSSLHELLGTLSVAIALLGPGAWSIDARLFGWKRLDIRPDPIEPPSRS